MATIEGEQVRLAELEEIVHRRERERLESSDVAKNLVGLALSGGGLRSGAVSLGVLQALYRRGVLPYIDYLSTVSGGGYAGAYLSSQSLNSNGRGPIPSAPGEAPVDPRQNGSASFPIAAGANDRQSQRMMEFIYSGSYLRKTWVFFNRYVIGLFLIWTVVLSGLFTAAALIVYCFYWLYFKPTRTWLTALSFDNDLTVSLFPSFILLLMWLGAWGVSYFKFGARATGLIARFVFYALILTTLVAVAALFGTGDIDISTFSDTPTSSSAATSLSKTIQTVLISAIVASLIPYFNPKLLVRSGMSPRGTVEKYTFWIATRALVYGVPFLVVSFFARENISGWNNIRDSKLTAPEVKDWSVFEPRNPSNYVTYPPPSNVGSIWPEEKLDLAKNSFNEMKELERQTLENQIAKDTPVADESVHLAIQNQQLTTLQLEKARILENSLNHRTMPTWSRWLHFAQLPLQSAGGLVTGTENHKANPVYQIAMSENQHRAKQESFLELVNEQLKDPNFYATFLPNDWHDTLSLQFKGNKEQEERIGRLQVARDEAARVGTSTSLSGSDLQTSDSPANSGSRVRKLLAKETKEREILKANRKLLTTFYPQAIGDASVIYSHNVWYADQRTRLKWFFWSAAIFLASSILVDLNFTSWHGFYATQIANMWIEPVAGLGRDIPLAQLDTTTRGRPYHLISGALHLMGMRTDQGRFVSRGRFLFSRLYCGSDRLAYLPTAQFMDGKFTLADAVAVSGAAVSPAQTSNPLILALLFLGNIRLGQWVTNPSRRLAGPSRWPVTPLRLLISFLRPAERRPFCFVSDGGHHENLGVEPLLERRCRLILASDAGQDETHLFADFTRLLSRVRMEHGITFEAVARDQNTLTLDPLVPKEESQQSQSHFVIARIRYPEQAADAPASYLVYMKSSLTGDEGHELLQYKKFNPAFPHDPTADQFYDPRQFEAYRQLGLHMAEAMCANLSNDAKAGPMSVEQFIERLVGVPTRTRLDETKVSPVVKKWLNSLMDTSKPIEVREEAATKLEDVRHRVDLVITALISGLESGNETLRKTCALVLQTIARRCPPKLLLPAMQHQMPHIRQIAAEIIAEAMNMSQEADDEVTEVLMAQLQHPAADVRRAAKSALQAYCRSYRNDPDHHERIVKVRKSVAALSAE